MEVDLQLGDHYRVLVQEVGPYRKIMDQSLHFSLASNILFLLNDRPVPGVFFFGEQVTDFTFRDGPLVTE